ncbi:MAG: imidazoleglycerol-phosphate dehydratase HisB [Proteobacteria bacterium]|nr:imidazoleglycerol-phosphate dehydratase HisB [Pseudomonadota bacterium]MBU1688096.1 imidazoleglycerol-phosphate dehydratase HisB [Pseudomonadota bacterium]
MKSGGPRTGTVSRKTNETDITLTLDLDGQGKATINTGVPFLDHMLTLFTVHGFFNLTIEAQGDTDIDDHHTVEDLGICLGQAFKMAMGDFSGIKRYGLAAVPMDEALARVTLDFSNRPFLHYGVQLSDQKVGRFDTALAQEFLRAFTLHGGLTLHVEVVHGENTHHILEAVFKALARGIDQATSREERNAGPLSSKGLL